MAKMLLPEDNEESRPEEFHKGFGTQCCEINEIAARGLNVDRSAIAQEAAEADEVAATIATLEASLPFVQQEAEVRRKATKIDLGNRVAYLEARANSSIKQHERTVEACLSFGPHVFVSSSLDLQCRKDQTRN
jgi:hypothetical protein